MGSSATRNDDDAAILDAIGQWAEKELRPVARKYDQADEYPTEIVEGLKGGETVVIEGNYALPDGTKVEPQMNTENTDQKEEEKEDKKEP